MIPVDDETGFALWAVSVPVVADPGRRVEIPVGSEDAAIGMSARWNGDAVPVRWTGDPQLHAAIMRGLQRALLGEWSE